MLGRLISLLAVVAVLLPVAPAAAAPGTLWGAHVDSGSESDNVPFEEALGRKLAVTRIYLFWDEAIPGDQAATDVANGRTPIVSFNTRRPGSSTIPWSEIAARQHDETLRAKAEAVRDFGHPLYLIFHHEPDNVHNEAVGTPAEFRAAWQVVHDVFSAVGTPNVTWIWTLSSKAYRLGQADQWYPGDAYTDLIGSDPYAYPERSWLTVAEPPLAFAAGRNKPLAFPEWGVGERWGDGDRARQVRQIAAWMKEHDIALAAYWSSQLPDKPDWRLVPGTEAFAAFRDVAHDPHFDGGSSLPLTVQRTGTGSGRVTSAPAGIDCGTTCAAQLPYGAGVTLTATPEPGSAFTGWSGAAGCTGVAGCTVTMTAARTVGATFTTTHQVAVARSGEGTGTVTSDPGGIDCGTICTAAYVEGAEVTLTATPSAGSAFAGWSLTQCAGTGSCVLRVGSAVAVEAHFEPATASEPVPPPGVPPDPDPVPPAPEGSPAGAGRGFAGEPGTTARIDSADPGATAIAVSRVRFDDAASDGRRAAHVVLSRDDAFPDSIAGAPLTGDGPLLLTSTAVLDDATAAEIERVLPAGATVYLLGGPAAIAQPVEDSLQAAGYRAIRLAGPSRVETALQVADEVRARFPDVRDVAVARAYGASGDDTSGWADSVTGGGFGARAGVPIVVNPTAALHPAVADWLRRDAPDRTLLLGGTAALAPAVEAGVPNPSRISGAERTATAAAVATTLWHAPSTGPRSFVVINGEHPSGWAFGLAAGGLAADSAAPILMVTGEVPAATAALVGACGPPEVALLLIGDATVVPESLRATLDDLDGGACPAG